MTEQAGNGAGRGSVRVLVADDDPLVRMLLAQMLSEDPRTSLVGQADDGGQAIALAARERPDVVLLDLALPDVDALTVIDTMVGAPDPPAVLVLTGFESDAEIEAATKAGARDHVVRSAPRDELLARIVALAGPR